MTTQFAIGQTLSKESTQGGVPYISARQENVTATISVAAATTSYDLFYFGK